MQFRSVNAAIRWAVENCAREIVTTSRYGEVTGGHGLTMQELKMQAGNIMSAIWQLPNAERAMIIIVFGCLDRLTEQAMTLADEIGYCGDKLMADCVLCYKTQTEDKATHAPSVRDLAKKYAMPASTVQYRIDKVKHKLDPIYFRAMALLECALGDLIEKAA